MVAGIGANCRGVSGVRGPVDVQNPAWRQPGRVLGRRSGWLHWDCVMFFDERFKAKKADAVTGQAGYNVSGSVRRRLSHTWGKAAGVENS